MSTPPEIIAFSVGPFESNCYALIEKNMCILIDPGEDAERILGELDRRTLRPEAILLTHGHVDHINALPGLLSRFPVPVYLHPADADWAFDSVNCLPPWYDAPPDSAPPDLRNPCASAPLEIGPWSFRVIETPGHTPGGVCYHLSDHDVLFSGDLLFQGSIGRTDLPGGDPTAMAVSLKSLLSLPPETRIFPGHGPATTLAHESQMNPWL